MLKDQAQSPQQTITQESYQLSQSLYPPPDLLADYAKANPQASDTLLQQAHEAHMAQLAIQAQQAKAHSRNRTISILSALTIASITVLLCPCPRRHPRRPIPICQRLSRFGHGLFTQLTP